MTIGTISLNGTDWQLCGYLGMLWQQAENELWAPRPGDDQNWISATVPGMVQTDLVRAKRIADPYHDLNSLESEWVWGRDWVYRRSFEVPAEWRGQRIWIHFEGVDDRCVVLLNRQELGEHRGVCQPFEFEITELVDWDNPNELRVAVLRAPDVHSQFGRTSETHCFKPRFAYGWDFAPRVVPLGIWQGVLLKATGQVKINNLRTQATLDESGQAHVQVGVATQSETPVPLRVVWRVQYGSRVIRDGAQEWSCTAQDSLWQHSCSFGKPQLWWPNRMGPQPLYTCSVELRSMMGEVFDQQEVSFGIRQLEWVQTAGAPEDALPYQPKVNGKLVPVLGWNWVPLDNCYGGEIDDRYDRFIALARAAGVNMLRVWGGGLIEKKRFYDLCDQAGIMVWQEFQMSSSGMDNEAPATPEFLSALETYAREVVLLRRNHPSLAVWCGGNELMRNDDFAPLTTHHPALACLQRVVNERDGTRLFLPTSGSGGFACLDARTAQHPDQLHDVHGPWLYGGEVAHYDLFNQAVVMLHSEFGAPGMSSVPSLLGCSEKRKLMPCCTKTPFWRHHGKWWLNRTQIVQLFGELTTLESFARASQFVQFEALRYAVESGRRHWPRCAGTLPWQFNEPWPNGSCTASVDWYGRPKPAYFAVARAYQPLHISLRYNHLVARRELPWLGEVWLSAWSCVAPMELTVAWAAFTLTGEEIARHSTSVTVELDGSRLVVELPEELGCQDEPILILLRVYTPAGELVDANDYLFGAAHDEEPPFRFPEPLSQTRLVLNPQRGDALTVVNESDIPGIWVEVTDDLEPKHRPRLIVDQGYFCLGPREQRTISVSGLAKGDGIIVSAWNASSVRCKLGTTAVE